MHACYLQRSSSGISFVQFKFYVIIVLSINLQLGLVEKNIVSHDFDMVVSDHSDASDANTNSTTLFSDDTDDKSRKSTNPEMCVSAHQEDEVSLIT